MNLIDDIQNFRRFWSVKLAALGGILMAVGEFGAEYLAQAWALLPLVFQQSVPPAFVKVTAIVLVFGSIVARAIKQPKKE